jgi:hypothetical protein
VETCRAALALEPVVDGGVERPEGTGHGEPVRFVEALDLELLLLGLR